MNNYFLLFLIITNIIAFIAFYVDKQKAIKHKQRISEKALFLFALCFGGLGSLIAMYTFHHKTKKWYFKFFIPLITILQLLLIYYFFIKI